MGNETKLVVEANQYLMNVDISALKNINNSVVTKPFFLAIIVKWWAFKILLLNHVIHEFFENEIMTWFYLLFCTVPLQLL